MGNDYLSEKVSVNMNISTLASIDVLVDNGYYSNRSDFINQAVRDLLQKQQGTLDRFIEQKTVSVKPNKWFLGLYGLSVDELEVAKVKEVKLNIHGYGVLIIGDDINPQLLFDTVEAIQVKGKVICSEEIKKHFGLKK